MTGEARKHADGRLTDMDLHRVDLNLLVAFDAIMTERGVTKAANRLSVSQSAMSATLARLRRLFDDPILVRQGRGVVPTPFAESLASPVREALDLVRSVLAQRAEFDPARDDRSFRVVANDYLQIAFLHPLLARLAGEHPGVRVHITGTGEDFAERLRNNTADMLILPLEAWSGYVDYPHRVLFRDRYLIAVDRDHPDVDDTFSYEQFTTLPYLATSSGLKASQAEMQLDALGIHRNTEITTGFGVAPFLLRGTRLFMLIHERLASHISRAANIKLLDPPIHGLEPITETLVWSPRTDHDPAHRWFRQRIIDLAEELG